MPFLKISFVNPSVISWSINYIKVLKQDKLQIHCVFKEKLRVFSQLTATHPLHQGEQPILVRDLSVHSLLLAVSLIEAQCWRGRGSKIL